MIAAAIAPGWACLARLDGFFESVLGSSTQSRRLASSNQVRQTATGARLVPVGGSFGPFGRRPTHISLPLPSKKVWMVCSLFFTGSRSSSSWHSAARFIFFTGLPRYAASSLRCCSSLAASASRAAFAARVGLSTSLLAP